MPSIMTAVQEAASKLRTWCLHGLTDDLVIALYKQLVLVIGFVALQEPVTWARMLALGLIAVGVLLLQTQGG